ncbi:MAG: response regulator transcription factor [Chloroflexi bacterium]|uniref:Response regulator transcription factor n=1 Tax=Candidatus Chlorohelix allophototropha TaxID=3003348 RepID=A0A8T7M455_9CHLR|nr:response regulator transcription factor [Chloroflexota bacterium]WJW70157.1 response regulator transcription factor [Chloroflexota bacterium L227-S17]
MEHLLVIDDDPAVTSLLRRGFSYEGFSVATAARGEAGLTSAKEETPDLVILDMMMPGIGGLEVLKRLKASYPKLPVILLTAKDATVDQVQGFESGADDYVVKPFTFEILLARVRVLLRRHHPEKSVLLKFADLVLDANEHQVHRSKRQIALTGLEFKLLQLFLEHPRQVLSKDVLLDKVWGYDFGGNANVVEVYVMQLRQKLEEKSEPRLIHTVRGAGYILKEE